MVTVTDKFAALNALYQEAEELLATVEPQVVAEEEKEVPETAQVAVQPEAPERPRRFGSVKRPVASGLLSRPQQQGVAMTSAAAISDEKIVEDIVNNIVADVQDESPVQIIDSDGVKRTYKSKAAYERAQAKAREDDIKMKISLSKKWTACWKQVCNEILGRDELVLSTAMAVASAEHIVQLGEPGTAKSMAGVLLTRRIINAKHLTIEFSPSTPAEAVLGPYDIKRMTERSEMVRKITERTAQGTEYLTGEEFFNGPVSTHQAMHMIANERIFWNGEDGRIDVPLKSIIAPTNKMPTSHELKAMLDRMKIRAYVENLDESMWMDLLHPTYGKKPLAEDQMIFMQGTEMDLLQQWTKSLALSLPDEIKYLMVQFRRKLLELGLEITDRSFRGSMFVIAAHAVCHGGAKVERKDLDALRFCFWRDHKNDSPKIKAALDHVKALKLPEATPTAAAQNQLKIWEMTQRARLFDASEIIQQEVKELLPLKATGGHALDTQRERVKAAFSTAEKLWLQVLTDADEQAKLDVDQASSAVVDAVRTAAHTERRLGRDYVTAALGN